MERNSPRTPQCRQHRSPTRNWKPFTGNRQFKRDPRMAVAADGVHLIDDKGRKVLDGLSGMWCCSAGHNRREITSAVHAQMQLLDYAPDSQFGHRGAFELANRIKALTPDANRSIPRLTGALVLVDAKAKGVISSANANDWSLVLRRSLLLLSYVRYQKKRSLVDKF